MIEWTRACHADLAGASSGSYMNFQDREERVGESLTTHTQTRLRSVKESYDPDRLFGPEHAGS